MDSNKEAFLENIEKYIESGADVNLKGDNEKYLLHQAVEENNLQACTRLVEVGADVNVTDRKRKTALHIGAIHNRKDICKYLIHAGADVNVTDRKGKSALHIAAIHNRIDICRYLLRAKADVNSQSYYEGTPFYLAVLRSNFELARHLLEAGADINARDKNGNTALYITVMKNKFEIFNFLIKMGANVNLRYSESATCLHIALKNNFEKISEKLIEKGADIEAKGLFGQTPLMLAAFFGTEHILKRLLKLGADINVSNIQGVTALFYACRSHCVYLKLLLEAGADIKAKAYNGKTCLMEAVIFNEKKNFIELLKAGANIHDRDNDGLSALGLACSHIYTQKNQDISMIETLIELGANIDENSIKWRNPLSISADRMNEKSVLKLFETGADVNIRSEDGTFQFKSFVAGIIKDIVLNQKRLTDKAKNILELFLQNSEIGVKEFTDMIEFANSLIGNRELATVLTSYFVLRYPQIDIPMCITSIECLSLSWDMGRDQINKMQCHYLGTSSLNVHNYLTERDPNKRAHLLSPKEIEQQDVHIAWCKNNCPIYYIFFRKRFSQDVKRAQLLWRWNYIAKHEKFDKLSNVMQAKIGDNLINGNIMKQT